MVAERGRPIYRTQGSYRIKPYIPATHTSQSLHAKAEQSGYERSLLITKINSCFRNAFHMSCPFQCHRTTSLNYICKIIIHCSKRLSVSHVTYSFTHTHSSDSSAFNSASRCLYTLWVRSPNFDTRGASLTRCARFSALNTFLLFFAFGSVSFP
jgi:hypothetical protein